jgi:hypothetical protein
VAGLQCSHLWNGAFLFSLHPSCALGGAAGVVVLETTVLTLLTAYRPLSETMFRLNRFTLSAARVRCLLPTSLLSAPCTDPARPSPLHPTPSSRPSLAFRLFPSLPSHDTTALWTKELEVCLLDGSCDAIVHCLKDVPTEFPPGCTLGAVLEREDPTDALVVKAGLPYTTLEELPEGSVIGTSSVRRVAQLRRKFPGLKFADVVRFLSLFFPSRH